MLVSLIHSVKINQQNPLTKKKIIWYILAIKYILPAIADNTDVIECQFLLFGVFDLC